MREPEFRADLSQIMAQPGEEAQPVTRFLKLPNPPSRPAAPDFAMTFANEPVASAPGEPWTWAGAIALNGSDAPIIAEANARRVHLATGADMPFPGSATESLSPESILPFDFNYDFKTDLLLAGDKGVRLFRQDQPRSLHRRDRGHEASHGCCECGIYGRLGHRSGGRWRPGCCAGHEDRDSPPC